MNLKRKYEIYASYSLAPGLVFYGVLMQYLFYTRDITFSVFTDILFIDVSIQIVLTIISASIISAFWLLPAIKYLEDRKEVQRP